jgi:hypothetical protein
MIYSPIVAEVVLPSFHSVVRFVTKPALIIPPIPWPLRLPLVFKKTIP